MLLLYLFIQPDIIWHSPNLHSTMLLLYPKLPSFFLCILCKFTFHYASTLSCFSSVILLWICNNLHSTMLLLYRSIRPRPVSGMHIYIPLCFYFIRFNIFLIFPLTTFTFHYASTLSFWMIGSHGRGSNLHSTMLLLYLLLISWAVTRLLSWVVFKLLSLLSPW